ncbi:MAG: hypothetical protein IPN66_06585 [Candidatus Competibacteraceae bacterium]|jgi:DNA-directed RNA polymerase subunit RPC12/RpoP|nr:hypothetical protein [Candidatus Competibacteraceae bacterium]MBK7543266.1 hypothetical protein [Candidatus Competibacteraceae bacterium]MBK8896709.1 hypothetical protein [Candidatus Competibacteraceae bacterium]MBK8896883.1 hypothetical protein [Candidatus Competibacteraceae bacterium]
MNDQDKSKAGAAALLRAMRQTKIYRCVECGTEFSASDARAMFCSNRCQQRRKVKNAREAKVGAGVDPPS